MPAQCLNHFYVTIGISCVVMVGVLALTPSESKVVMTGDLAQERLEEEDQNIIEGEGMKGEDERVEKYGSHQMKDQQKKKSLRVLLLIISLFGLAPVAVLKVQEITSYLFWKD
jgi:hypothetical protein